MVMIVDTVMTLLWLPQGDPITASQAGAVNSDTSDEEDKPKKKSKSGSKQDDSKPKPASVSEVYYRRAEPFLKAFLDRRRLLLGSPRPMTIQMKPN